MFDMMVSLTPSHAVKFSVSSLAPSLLLSHLPTCTLPDTHLISLPHTLTHTQSLSPTHSQTHTQSLSHTHSISLYHTLTHTQFLSTTHSHTLNFSLPHTLRHTLNFSLPHTLRHTLNLSLPQTLRHTLNFSLPHTLRHTLNLSHTLSDTHSISHTYTCTIFAFFKKQFNSMLKCNIIIQLYTYHNKISFMLPALTTQQIGCSHQHLDGILLSDTYLYSIIHHKASCLVLLTKPCLGSVHQLTPHLN